LTPVAAVLVDATSAAADQAAASEVISSSEGTKHETENGKSEVNH